MGLTRLSFSSFLTALGVVALTAVVLLDGAIGDSASGIGQLPFCGNQATQMSSGRLLYVSTLDGKITALDIAQSGKVYWTLPTEPGALISSCIHRLDLTSNGQFVRMIPSLSGGIYKFDGLSVEPIPVTADNLLSSSFKFSDDLVISGGKESRSYGISARTGQLLYECSMKGCVNTTDPFMRSNDSDAVGAEESYISEDDHNPQLDDVIVVRRQTQTVSAADCRTGNVRWNFSVAQHELEFVKSTECHDRPLSDIDMAILDIEFRVVVPEGTVYAFNNNKPGVVLWTHKFDHPIVSVWKVDADFTLQSIDLFSTGRWPDSVDNPEFNDNIHPFLYVGTYREQLYIQESLKLQEEIRQITAESTNPNYPRIPWKPMSAKSTELITPNAVHELQITAEKNKTALAMLFDVDVGGVFLYTAGDLNKTGTALCEFEAANESKASSASGGEEFGGFPFEESDTPVKFVVVSLWYWWKEILVISLTSATLLNLIFTSRIRREREIVVIERHIPVPTAVEATEELATVPTFLNRSGSRSISESNSQNGDFFTSRFQTDFDLMQCLGKGGFGVVFEAKNKLDGCLYAVKRIALPVKKESRERVMREVKTLANCEHHNIVRYFQAWMESPPNGWQEVEDTKWMAMDMSLDLESGTTLPSYTKTTSEVFSNQHTETIDEDEDDDDDDDSVVEFKADSQEGGGDCVSIDTHMNGKVKNGVLDCTSLSNSFEIEFVDSTEDKNDKSYHSRRRAMSYSSGDKALIPLPSKPQNKIYLYIQMQLCQKQSLKDWLRENKLDMRKPHIDSIFEQIVDAVVYVHSKGLIHRDLKPSNIFFSLNGQIKIGDFGLVTDTGDMPESVFTPQANLSKKPATPHHTQQVGTHLYMSPEQLRGMRYDLKVDIFSLGLIFFELLMYFGTEMERIVTLKAARDGIFPTDFDLCFPKEAALLKTMLSNLPDLRPQADEIKKTLVRSS